MRDVLPLSWPCKVTRAPDGRYVVTPFAAMQCARTGATLQTASDSAKNALAGHVGRLLHFGDRVEPPGADHVRPEDLRAGRVIRVLVEDRTEPA